MPKVIPSLSGNWTVTGEILIRRSKDEEPNLDEVQNIKYVQTIEQKRKICSIERYY
jgi:hypothetical protein